MKTDQDKRDMFAAAVIQGWAASALVNVFHPSTVNNAFELADKMVKRSNELELCDRQMGGIKS